MRAKQKKAKKQAITAKQTRDAAWLWVECLFSIHKPRVQFLVLHKPSVVVLACNPSTQEGKGGGSVVQGHSWFATSWDAGDCAPNPNSNDKLNSDNKYLQQMKRKGKGPRHAQHVSSMQSPLMLWRLSPVLIASH